MKMTIGTKIQTLRKQRGLSQEQLAEALGVSRQAVSKWEAEQSVPDIDKIILICDYFGVTTDHILRNTESHQAEQEPEPQPDSLMQNNTSQNEVNAEEKKKAALLLAVAIMLYIISVVPPILIDDAAGSALMFVMVAVATGIIVYRSILNSRNKSEEETEPKQPENSKLKAVKNSVRALSVVLFFVISFLSGAWYITWLVFPITVAINNIIEACFDLKDGDDKCKNQQLQE